MSLILFLFSSNHLHEMHKNYTSHGIQNIPHYDSIKLFFSSSFSFIFLLPFEPPPKFRFLSPDRCSRNDFAESSSTTKLGIYPPTRTKKTLWNHMIIRLADPPLCPRKLRHSVRLCLPITAAAASFDDIQFDVLVVQILRRQEERIQCVWWMVCSVI